VFEWIGWIATAVFACSYFCKQPTTLRRLQALAALMWIGYGLIIGAAPVVAANSVVAVLAIYSTRRQRLDKTGMESELTPSDDRQPTTDCRS
jgi:inner membrane protein